MLISLINQGHAVPVTFSSLQWFTLHTNMPDWLAGHNIIYNGRDNGIISLLVNTAEVSWVRSPLLLRNIYVIWVLARVVLP